MFCWARRNFSSSCCDMSSCLQSEWQCMKLPPSGIPNSTLMQFSFSFLTFSLFDQWPRVKRISHLVVSSLDVKKDFSWVLCLMAKIGNSRGHIWVARKGQKENSQTFLIWCKCWRSSWSPELSLPCWLHHFRNLRDNRDKV